MYIVSCSFLARHVGQPDKCATAVGGVMQLLLREPCSCVLEFDSFDIFTLKDNSPLLGTDQGPLITMYLPPTNPLCGHTSDMHSDI